MARSNSLRSGLIRTIAILGACLGLAPLLACKNDSVRTNAQKPPMQRDTPWPEVVWPLSKSADDERRLDALIAQMSVREKIGQIVQADIASVTPADVKEYRLGSVLAGGNSDPNGKYNADASEWLKLADAFYDASMAAGAEEHAIPILFGIDAVHGQSNVVGATLFPHNIGLGATRNVELMRKIGAITAVETRVTGMEWAFAPTVAVPQDDRWGRTYEGFSESPELVASYAAAIVEGLQGKAGSAEFLDAEHVMVSVKHFVGDGGTTNGKDQGDTALSEAELARVHGAGYPPAIAAGAQSVMASFNSFNQQKLHGHQHLLTEVLKGRMNFGGFVVGDWNGHGQVAGCSNDNCAASFNAGVDMLMAPDSWKGYYQNALASVQSGAISMQRLDEAVRRILRVKLRLGLFEAGRPSQRTLGGKFALLGAPEHRAVARQAVRESLVLLKNNQGVLPIDPRRNILVAGDGANDLGKQAGGWTLNWQGTGTQRADFPGATTIFEAIQQHVARAGGIATLAPDGRFTSKPDVAIVVFGENPYAEFQGDLPNLAYKAGDDSDLKLIQRLKAKNIPVVAIFLSGRPLWVNREINAADAFVAAWLPGSEGGGISDVLLRGVDGKIAYDFTGKLSFSWPKTATQYRNNVGQADYDPQFAFGYGLRYGDDGNVAALPEQSGLSGEQTRVGVYFERGVATAGVSVVLEDDQGQVVALDQPQVKLPDGSLAAIATDYLAQEDARRLQWSGTRRARFSVRSQQALDLTRESNGDVMVVLTLRVDQSGPESITLGMHSGANLSSEISMHDALGKLPVGQWTRVGVPLKCFAAAGAQLQSTEALWIQTPGRWRLSVARLALGAQNEAEHVSACLSVQASSPDAP